MDPVNQRSLDHWPICGFVGVKMRSREAVDTSHRMCRQGAGRGPRAPDSWAWDLSRILRERAYCPFSYLRAYPYRQPGCLFLNNPVASWSLQAARLSVWVSVVDFPYRSYLSRQGTGTLHNASVSFWICEPTSLCHI